MQVSKQSSFYCSVCVRYVSGYVSEDLVVYYVCKEISGVKVLTTVESSIVLFVCLFCCGDRRWRLLKSCSGMCLLSYYETMYV